MKYALKYFSTSKKLAEVDEIIIKYDETTPLDHLTWFATEKCKPEQRLVINFDITDVLVDYSDKNGDSTFLEKAEEYLAEEVEKIKVVKEQHPNIAIKLETTFGKVVYDFVKMLKDNEIPFFLRYYPRTIAEIKALVDYGVSDIYITEYLAFYMTEIADKVVPEEVNIRVYPNVSQIPSLCSLTESEEDIKSFFIRPEDLDVYEDYVDIIEFYGSIDKQDVLMDIYKDGYWMGNLNELILNFKEDINCMNLMPDFGFYRLACGHRCDLGRCNYCDISKSLAGELRNKDIYIKKTGKKKRDEYNANEESGFDEGAEAIQVST